MEKYKRGDSRGNAVQRLIFAATFAADTNITYRRMGYWDDIARHEGADTLAKLKNLEGDMSPEAYKALADAIVEDNKNGEDIDRLYY